MPSPAARTGGTKDLLRCGSRAGGGHGVSARRLRRQSRAASIREGSEAEIGDPVHGELRCTSPPRASRARGEREIPSDGEESRRGGRLAPAWLLVPAGACRGLSRSVVC